MPEFAKPNGPAIVDSRGFELVTCRPDDGYSLWMRNNGDGTATFEEITQLDPFFRKNAEARSETFGKKWGEGQIAASIPESYAWSSGYMDAVVNKDNKWVKKFLNDSDHQKLRTKEGRL